MGSSEFELTHLTLCMDIWAVIPIHSVFLINKNSIKNLLKYFFL